MSFYGYGCAPFAHIGVCPQCNPRGWQRPTAAKEYSDYIDRIFAPRGDDGCGAWFDDSSFAASLPQVESQS